MLGTALDGAQVARARRIIDESGAHAQVEMVIKELADRALLALDRATIDDGARVVLRELASAATQRAV
jgi:geranylgeranyl diphosphate synthase type I